MGPAAKKSTKAASLNPLIFGALCLGGAWLAKALAES